MTSSWCEVVPLCINKPEDSVLFLRPSQNILWIFDCKIHTIALLLLLLLFLFLLGPFQKFCLKIAKIENCQNWKLLGLKIAKIEGCQNCKLPKLKLPKLKVAKIVFVVDVFESWIVIICSNIFDFLAWYDRFCKIEHVEAGFIMKLIKWSLI